MPEHRATSGALLLALAAGRATMLRPDCDAILTRLKLQHGSGEFGSSLVLRARSIVDEHLRPLILGTDGLAKRMAGMINTVDGSFARGYVLTRGGVAVLDASGLLAQNRADVTDSEGAPMGTASQDLRATLDLANADPQVGAVLVRISSPGGYVDGGFEGFTALCDCEKPVGVFVDHGAYSAGYLWAIGADPGLLMLAPEATVGCIGVRNVHIDRSGEHEQNGWKVTPFVSHPRKDIGADYRPLRDDEKAWFQSEVMKDAGRFTQAIAQRRGVEPAMVDQWAAAVQATGGTAVHMGMADQIVGTLEEAAALMAEQAAKWTQSKPGARTQATSNTTERTKDQLSQAPRASVAQGATHKGPSMSITRENLATMAGGPELISTLLAEGAASAKPKAATIEELEAAFPGDAGHVLASAKARHTVTEAKAAQVELLRLEAKAATERATKAEGELTALKAARAAVKPVGTAPVGFVGSGDVGNEAGTLEALASEIAAKAKADGKPLSFQAAIYQAGQQNPELHKKWLAKQRGVAA